MIDLKRLDNKIPPNQHWNVQPVTQQEKVKQRAKQEQVHNNITFLLYMELLKTLLLLYFISY